MPRYYFNLFNDVDVMDDEGAELSDLEAARHMAYESAAELVGEQIVQQKLINPGHYIQVLDENRATVFTLVFADLISRT